MIFNVIYSAWFVTVLSGALLDDDAEVCTHCGAIVNFE